MRLKTSTLFVCAIVSILVWSILFLVYYQYQQQSPANQIYVLEQLRTDAQGQKLQMQLESAQRRVRELEDQILHYQQGQQQQPLLPSLSKKEKDEFRQVKDDLQQCQAQQRPAVKTPAFTHQNPICQLLHHPIPTAASLWTSHLSAIHAASQLPNDHKFYFHDFTAQLLHLVSPRLPLSVQSPLHEKYWNQVDKVLKKAHQRYDYILHPGSYHGRPIPPPVNIVIMGGSLLVGMNCRKIVRDLGFQLRLPLQDCSWANRLEKVINQFLLNRVFPGNVQKQTDLSIVQVTKIAMGGTNTQTGTQILEYDLIPPQAKNPDIVINAYSTNDLHVLTVLEAQSGNSTLRDKVFDMIQDFVRKVLSSRCQPAPILIHLDDYLGNEQRELWATTELSQGVQVLAHYYGFASASYANVVRDWVYGDTREYWFSPEGWYSQEQPGSMLREIHPNMGMHIVAAWIVAYNLLHMVTDFCSLEGWNLQTTATSSERMHYNSTRLNNLPELNGKRWPKGKPKASPQGLPPPLTKTLSLENVSELWRASESQQQSQQDCTTQSNAVKCPFSWLSGISSLLEKPSAVEAYFRQHTTFHPGEWRFLDDHGKLGMVPQTNSPMTIELSNLQQSIRKVTVFFMKSYGPKWEGAQVRVQCFQKKNDLEDWQLLQHKLLLGFHDKHTSETYTEHLELQNTLVAAGSSLKLELDLVEGSTFKIMGIAICS